MVRILKTTLLVLAATALAACGADKQGARQAPPPVVEVAQVLAEPATLWNDFTGRVAAPETVELRPRVSGYLEQVAFTEGELVQRGDLLFSIDPRPYRARERAAQAELASARSQLTLARSQAERAQQLLKSRAISRDEFDRRNATRDSAKAAVDAAEAALENARLDLQYTQVEAPISGRVGRAFITRGNLASADQTLLTTLVSVDPMYVYFESDQQTFVASRSFFTPEQHPEVRVGLAGEPGFPHRGQLDFIDNRLNSHTGTIQFRAVIPNPTGTFKPGQFARVQMPTEQLSRAVLVNRKAVLTDQDRRFVYVVDGENRVARREVEAGPQMDELVVIRRGLDSGERIVVNGLQKIFAAGVQVEPQLVQMRAQDSDRQLAAR
ncbi:efflux RND transporter periplasmic adaptor subunit [Microbulbifer rhizosphaerae]|uniref:Multidrug efflux system membrane fusion protein n=1 Tax=Microbulbifer rhizosphaerae TaxID=1562603 RepID=A0A7W4WFB0_9GAMM|nr:efflux RND transporter periplasmic adaptor subunit [Microbulbifer rhizosphaerae]MBB3063170.1 multidrug efflux system membrane fusion protein [Microbulbifer rhizosphaerae]